MVRMLGSMRGHQMDSSHLMADGQRDVAIAGIE